MNVHIKYGDFLIFTISLSDSVSVSVHTCSFFPGINESIGFINIVVAKGISNSLL